MAPCLPATLLPGLVYAVQRVRLGAMCLVRGLGVAPRPRGASLEGPFGQGLLWLRRRGGGVERFGVWVCMQALDAAPDGTVDDTIGAVDEEGMMAVCR